MKFASGGLLDRLRQTPAAVNFGWLTFERVNRLVVAVLLGAWTARVLGPADYGRLNYALALVAVLAAVSSLGLDPILRRELVRNAPANGALLGTTFCLRVAMGALCYGVLAILIGLGAARFAPTDVILILGATLIQPGAQTIDSWFHARLEARTVVMAQNAALFVSSLARILVLIWWPSLKWIALTFVFDFAAAAAFVSIAYRRGGQRITAWRFETRVARELLREAWPLVVSSAAIMIYHRIDQVMLPTLAGAAAAGQYAAAVRVVEVWHFVPVALAASCAPRLVRAHAEGAGAFDSTVSHQFNRYALITWALAIGTAIAGPWLLPALFGDAFSEAGRIAILLAASLPFVGIGVARGEAWVAAGQTRFSLWAALLGAVTNVLLNLYCIPRWGAAGAAAATVVSYGLAAVGATFCWRETRRIGKHQLNALLLRGVLWGRST